MSILKTHEIKKFRKTYTTYEKACPFEGYQLAVLFDEKDEVKKLGGRWDNDTRTWWMPEGRLNGPDGRGPGTVREWLNTHKMVMGHYGVYNNETNLIDQCGYEEYRLKDNQTNREMLVWWYEECDAVKFFNEFSSTTEWFKIADARKQWDMYIDAGYTNTKIENNS